MPEALSPDMRFKILDLAQGAENERQAAKNYSYGGAAGGYPPAEPGKEPPKTEAVLARAEAYAAFVLPPHLKKGKSR